MIDDFRHPPPIAQWFARTIRCGLELRVFHHGICGSDLHEYYDQPAAETAATGA